jgi:hypothetical protein
MDPMTLLLKLINKVFTFYLNRLPNSDSWAEVYCVFADLIKNNNILIEELPTIIKEAKTLDKLNTDLCLSRGKEYCQLERDNE